MFGFIYITTNNINNKKYIGQKTYDDKNTWKTYLGSGVILKKAVQKYGKQNFTRQILCQCQSQEQLNTMQKYYINLYKANISQDFYNITQGGQGFSVKGQMNPRFGTHLSDETKHKIGSKNSKHRSKRVICVQTGQIFSSCKEAGQSVSGSKSGICACINGLQQTHRGYHWKYVDEEINKHYQHKQREFKTRRIKCVQTNKEYNSILEASKQIGVSKSTLCGCLRGDQHTCAGKHWIYID